MTDFDVSMSEQCAELFTALAAFQGEVTPPKKTASNPHFKSKFADLADVLEAVRAPLAKHGLSLTQMAVGACDGYVRVVTLVGHKSGQWLKGTLDMPLPQKTPQGVGSAISYARRYCAMAALGIAAEDDDGERAEGRGPGGAKQAAPQTAQQPSQGLATTLATLRRELVAQDGPHALADFYIHARAELAKAGAPEQVRKDFFDEWGKRCHAQKINPRQLADAAIAGDARKRAEEAA